jgi:hypothetical protein
LKINDSKPEYDLRSPERARTVDSTRTKLVVKAEQRADTLENTGVAGRLE